MTTERPTDEFDVTIRERWTEDPDTGEHSVGWVAESPYLQGSVRDSPASALRAIADRLDADPGAEASISVEDLSGPSDEDALVSIDVPQFSEYDAREVDDE